MQEHIRKPDRHASGRENSTDPEPGGVKITVDPHTRDITIVFPTEVDVEYMRTVLSTIIQELQVDDGGEQALGADGCNSSINGKEYDVFISHASEDKEPLVNELVQHLESLGIKVWYDKTHISWGDSFRVKMDEGLNQARYGIVILSPDYIKDGKYWTKAELDAFFQMESATGKKVLLPVWHHISKNEVMHFSPFVATRNALSTTTKTTAEIAIEVAKIIRTDK